MLNESTRSFMLGNSLAAVSAVALNEATLATDGNDSKIHIFKRNGAPNGFIETARAYRRLRCLESNGGLTALSCRCERRLYFIGSEYRELGYTELELGCESELSDASVASIEGVQYIVGATRSNAFLFDMNGKRLELICKADRNEAITDFIRPKPELFALASEKNGVKTVSVYENGVYSSAIVPREISLRMLIYKDDIIYGLFGFGYIYNRIIPIHSESRLILPNGNYSEY
ncbi:MAG: hypothetical protein IJB49_00915 [Clostridia bacterium]|nr:hypothetical protein [Clostridia bacterium]